MQSFYKQDCWYIPPDNPSIKSAYRFDFNHFVSQKIKEQVKAYFIAQFQLGKIKKGSLARYCNGWRFFSDYLAQARISINSLGDISPAIVDGYMLFLNSTVKSSHTKTLIFSAFKNVIRYGQFLGLPGYPKQEVFSGSMARAFQHDDELKSREIPQYILDQIDKAILCEKDIYIKTAVSIARFTGIRLSEILCIEENCVIKDFMDKPLLLSYSFKNNKERAIPIPSMA